MICVSKSWNREWAPSKFFKKFFVSNSCILFWKFFFFEKFDGAHYWYLFLIALIKSKVEVQVLFCSFLVSTFRDTIWFIRDRYSTLWIGKSAPPKQLDLSNPLVRQRHLIVSEIGLKHYINFSVVFKIFFIFN